MRKTDKKIDNEIRSVLTEACEEALECGDGFRWLTHVVNYQRFPASLLIICVYDTNANLENADKQSMRTLIRTKLRTMNVTIKDEARQITFDTEENCHHEHAGNWRRRLAVE